MAVKFIFVLQNVEYYFRHKSLSFFYYEYHNSTTEIPTSWNKSNEADY